jgi:transcriptional repressor NrdR
MRCPECSCVEDKVIDSRSVREGAGVRRRRECTGCGHRYTTYEGIIQEELKVIKSNNIREDFNPEKLRRGIENACYKRPIDEVEKGRIVNDIINSLQKDYDREVPSSAIGNRIMKALKELDQVAYVRFASVYRRFKDLDELLDEVSSLRGEE